MGNKHIYIGCSGYQYDHWKENFYPPDLNKNQWLDYYQNHFNTVEINNTFYNLPEKSTFRNWKQTLQPDFKITLKFSRYATHMKKLKDPQDPIKKFLDHANPIRDRIATILVQLPPNWHCNPQRLDNFLSKVPTDQRWAVEFRDKSWLNEEVYDILSRHDAALVMHDLIDGHPRRRTASWSYWRMHGRPPGEKYSHQYLTARADEIAKERKDGRDTFVYFNNDKNGYAVQNARQLRRYLQNR